jgi:hypothetical protein
MLAIQVTGGSTTAPGCPLVGIPAKRANQSPALPPETASLVGSIFPPSLWQDFSDKLDRVDRVLEDEVDVGLWGEPIVGRDEGDVGSSW